MGADGEPRWLRAADSRIRKAARETRHLNNIEAKAAVLVKRQEAKNAAAAVEEDLKACDAEAALAGAGDVDAAAAHCADTTSSVLKTHGKKKGHIWSAYDLTGEK
jgi:hypothetical protein